MISDYFAKSRSLAELQDLGAQLKAKNGIHSVKVLDLKQLMTSGWVETIGGKKRLVVEIVPDDEIDSNDAIAISGKKSATIRIKSSVWNALNSIASSRSEFVAFCRARFTLAHEYAHILLCHDKAPMARSSGVNYLSARPKSISAYASSEWQANALASIILVDINLLNGPLTVDNISNEFKVNTKSAEIILEGLQKRARNPKIVEGFKKLKSLLSATDNNVEFSALGPTTVGQLCPYCGEQSVVSIGGNRTICSSCHRAGDSFQDGDSFGIFEL